MRFLIDLLSIFAVPRITIQKDGHGGKERTDVIDGGCGRMKLIIDIPEDMFEWFKNGEIIDEYDKSALKQVFKNGIPLDGMTNGEVIQALFPKAKVFKEESNIEYPYVDVFLYSENDMNCYKKDWWNAPYKKGGEE